MSRPLNIAIDASRTTRTHRTGTENYALQLIRQLLVLDSPHHFTLYFRDEPPADLFPSQANWTAKIITVPRLWTHFGFARALWQTRPDGTFVPAHTLPRFFPGKAVVTIHDLGYIQFPEAHPDRERRYLDWTTRYSANRATVVLVDAEATRRDLVDAYGITADKIQVVYPGVDESLAPVHDEAQLQAIRQKYGIGGDYLLFLGTLQPRKNIQRLVQAYQQWRKQSGNQDVALVLAGQKGWLYDEAWTQDVKGVILTGYVDDADISALYSGALALTFPSLFEGFGFPVVEAMRCETAVLCANTSSLPELGGEAALLVNPLDVAEIAEGIRKLVSNPTLRQDLVERGKVQVQQFTWENAARATLEALEHATTL